MIWRVVFAIDGQRVRAFEVPAQDAADAIDAAQLLLTLEAVDAELVRVEKIEEDEQ